MPWEIYLLSISLLISTILSFYILVQIVFFKNKKFYTLNTWQFPMLLALLFDVVLYSPLNIFH